MFCNVSLTAITMPPLSSPLNSKDLRAHKTADNDNVVQGLLKKDWNWDWKWDYSDLYEANEGNDKGQKDSIDLSTESPFYFMGFYGQDRINEVTKRPPVNSYPNHTSQFPNTGFNDLRLATLTTSTRNPETIPKPPNPQTQQRTFLLTTLLPICIIIVILLAVALAIVWYLKFRGGATGRNQQKLDNEDGRPAVGNIDGSNGERVPLKEDKKTEGKKNGLTIANNGSQVTNKTPKKSRLCAIVVNKVDSLPPIKLGLINNAYYRVDYTPKEK
ncbi:unnamed protein product [Rodentolepis nana]|uniref:Neurofascin/L1/NrCAM C-terminal domain-containing protein n=1 Tax=Rodentolepis nana TaxID=102285 RepID=A0A158QIP6_RODNA|nr:unnamed protein product [Rodentolepis nana]